MAQLPPDFLSKLPPFSQAPTLFLPAVPGTLGILVRQQGRRTTATARQFRGGPAAALAWCLARRVSLVCFVAGAVHDN